MGQQHRLNRDSRFQRSIGLPWSNWLTYRAFIPEITGSSPVGSIFQSQFLEGKENDQFLGVVYYRVLLIGLD